LCDHLLKLVGDKEEITKQTPQKEAQDKLATRLEVSLRTMVDRMIEDHGIEGHSRKSLDLSEADYDTPAAEVDGRKAGVVGGIVGGAIYGLGADLMTGGLTFGGGVVVGAILGGLGALGLVSGYNKLMVAEGQHIRWSPEAFDRATTEVLLCYLRVAHYGRGRGEWNDPKHRKHWTHVVQQCLQSHEPTLHNIWKSSRNGDISRQQLHSLLTASARETLLELYPDVERFFD